MQESQGGDSRRDSPSTRSRSRQQPSEARQPSDDSQQQVPRPGDSPAEAVPGSLSHHVTPFGRGADGNAAGSGDPVSAPRRATATNSLITNPFGQSADGNAAGSGDSVSAPHRVTATNIPFGQSAVGNAAGSGDPISALQSVTATNTSSGQSAVGNAVGSGDPISAPLRATNNSVNPSTATNSSGVGFSISAPQRTAILVSSKTAASGMKEMFHEARNRFILVGHSNVQASSSGRYHNLANQPIDSFLTITKTASFDGTGTLVYDAPVIRVVQKLGVTWQGQPLAHDDLDFPTKDSWAITDELRAEDADSGGIIAAAGFCPVSFTLDSSYADTVKSWSNSLTTRQAPGGESFLAHSHLHLAFRGPAVGSIGINGRPGVPFAQSVVIVADNMTGVDLTSGVQALRVPLSEVLARTDKASAYVATDSNADGLWLATAAIPLPDGHGIPSDLEVRCDSNPTLASFISELTHAPSGRGKTFAWLEDPFMEAWFRAFGTAEGGLRLATTIISLREPKIQAWWDEMSNRTIESNTHKLWVHPLISTYHQMFLDWWLKRANSAVMLAKYKRFVTDAHTSYIKEPSFLGTPSQEGASFLFTLYHPEVKTWLEQFPFKFFRNPIFLAPYIASFSDEVCYIPARGANTPADPQRLKPLLSPSEKAKRSRDDDNTASTEPSANSADLLRAFFVSGSSPPGKRRQQSRSSESMDPVREEDDTEQGTTGQRRTLFPNQLQGEEAGQQEPAYWGGYQQNANLARSGERPPARVTFTQGRDPQIDDSLTQAVQRGQDIYTSTRVPTDDNSVLEIDPPQKFSDLPQFGSKRGISQGYFIPFEKRIMPTEWRTPQITMALGTSGHDFFNAEDVQKSDEVFQDSLRPPRVSEVWGINTKKDSSAPAPKILGAFDPVEFEQYAMHPLQCYALFACASRPANPDSWQVATIAKDSWGCQSRLDSDSLTFPGFISPEAFLHCIDPKASAQSAIDWIIRTAMGSTKLEQGPVKAKFVDGFRQAIGRTHLFKQIYASVSGVYDPELSWSALHWMQSAHDHQGHLRIPTNGYQARTIRDAVRNIWWFHYLLTSQRGTGSCYTFSQNGLLSDKLLRISVRFQADSKLDEAWSALASEEKEKISAHFCMRLSDLFDIFHRWMQYHPRYDLIRCELYGKPTRQDLFVLQNQTLSFRNRQESISTDLAHWQDSFDRDFTESQLLSLARDWPVAFPEGLKPASRTSLSQQKSGYKVSAEPSTSTKNHPSSTTGNQRESDQQSSNRQKFHKNPGEFKIADIPAFRLVNDPKITGETGAFLNFGKLIADAKKANPTGLSIPRSGVKQYCFRFMTAKCGCSISTTNPRYDRTSHTTSTAQTICDKIHLELAAGGNADSLSKEALQKLVAFAQTPPINEKIEPTPELLARTNK